MEKNNIYDQVRYIADTSIVKGEPINYDGFYFNCDNINLSYSDYELNGKEEKVLDYIYAASSLNLLEETSKILNNNVLKNEEKNFFIKLFLYDQIDSEMNPADGMEVLIGRYLPKLNTKKDNHDGINIGQLYQIMASDEIKQDKEFAKTILCLNGKNYIYLSDELKQDDELTDLAIKNDKSEFVTSFQNAPVEYQRKSENGIKYIKKLYEQNQEIDSDFIYNELLEKEEDGRYKFNTVLTSFNEDNQIQNEWLKDESFTPQLVRIDIDFVDYIVDKKIEVVLNEKQFVKTK